MAMATRTPESKRSGSPFAELLADNARSLQKMNTDEVSLLKELAENGQHPHTVAAACADSRVLIGAPGRIFVNRSIGEEMDRATTAGFEYAIAVLHAKNGVIVAHTKCGAVGAAIEKNSIGVNGSHAVDDDSALGVTITNLARGLRRKGSPTDHTQAAIENAIVQGERLVAGSPIVRDALARGEFTLGIVLDDISTGRLEVVKVGVYSNDTEKIAFVDPHQH